MQTALNEYFAKHWQTTRDALEHPLYQKIAGEIRPHEKVVDVGCGRNLFKNEYGIKNVTGIDPAFPEFADITTTLEDYKPQGLFDVALCMGSINFGDEQYIDDQVERVTKLVKPSGRIYWKFNPGRHDHLDVDKFTAVPIYPWTFEKARELARKHGYRQVDEDTWTDSRKERLYCVWIPAFPPL